MEFHEHYNNFFYKYFNSIYYLARCVEKTLDLEKEKEEALEVSLMETEEHLEEGDATMHLGDMAHQTEKEIDEKKQMGGIIISFYL